MQGLMQLTQLALPHLFELSLFYLGKLTVAVLRGRRQHGENEEKKKQSHNHGRRV